MSIVEPPSGGGPFRRIRDNLDIAAAHFADEAVQESIDKQVEVTLDWLLSRRGSYDHLGSLRENDPWWPALPYTDNVVIAATRLVGMHSAAFEHGLLHFMRGLESQRALLRALTKKDIEELVDASLPSLLREAVVWHHGIKPGHSVSLKKLAELLNFSRNTKITKARPRLDRLAELGLLTGRHRGEYAISLGPVGDAFYAKVFAPVIAAIDVNPKN